MAEEYALDHNKLLIMDADYNQQVFISLDQNAEGGVKPQLEYKGKNKRVGENIKKNVSELITLKQTEKGVELFLGDQRFAGFCLKDGRYVVDEDIPQEHLTAFEMRLLARPGKQNGVPFPRNIPKELSPKTDLHNHFAGSPTPEGLFELGLKHNLTVPDWMIKALHIDAQKLVRNEAGGGYYLTSLEKDPEAKAKLLDAMRLPKEGQEIFNRMEEIYAYRKMFTKDKKLLPDLLMLVGKELAEKGVKYTELSLSSLIEKMDVLETITRELPKVEKETGCRMRFLAALNRLDPKKLNQDLVDRIRKVAQNPYIVGIDVMGHERNSTQEFASEIKEVALWAMENDPNFCIRVHAGENPIFKDNVKDFLKVMEQARQEYAKSKGISEKKVKMPQIRVGHGLYGLDDETIDLCKKTGAIVEFNMSSNLALNNINFITDVPIAKYAQHGIPFVLGTDGQGLYSTAAEQEMVLAAAAGVSKEDLLKMRQTEDKIIATERENFDRKERQYQKNLESHSFGEMFAPVYMTEDGQPRYNEEQDRRERQEEIRRMWNVARFEMACFNIEMDPQKVNAIMEERLPIMIAGASERRWADIAPEDQAEIRKTMQLLSNVLDSKKAYVLTGGANQGVEREMHMAAHQRNMHSQDELAVVGALTEHTASQDRSKVERDTITHAVILTMKNGRPAKTSFDLADAVLPGIRSKNGEVIAIGGGSVVSDIIQRAYNMGLNLNVMDGPAGASTDKAKTMPEECSFKTAEGLIRKIYERHPDIFILGFDINRVSQYITGGKSDQNDVKAPTPKKTVKRRVGKMTKLMGGFHTKGSQRLQAPLPPQKLKRTFNAKVMSALSDQSEK